MRNTGKKTILAAATALMAAGIWTARGAGTPQASVVQAQASVVQAIEAQGGYVVRDSDGNIVEVSLARTWATDNDIERIVEIKGLKRLDLSFTYVSDRGVERLQQLQQLEDLTLDTAEFITDAAVSYLRANRGLRRLNLRGTDVTDISLPYLAELTGLRSLDLSHTQIGDVGFESLPALADLEELNVGGTRISGLNLNVLRLLPKLKKLSFNGIQHRNGGACWSALIIDLDLDTISLLSGLEELDLGIGFSLGKGGRPMAPDRTALREGDCRVAGGIKLSDLGLAKLAKLKKLRRLDFSGAQLTPAGLKVLQGLPQLERLSLWNCTALDDSAAEALAAIPSLTNLDVSYTPMGDPALQRLATLPRLKYLYLTDTKVTPVAVAAFRKDKPACFVSWVQRPAPRSAPNKKASAAKSTGDSQ